MCNKSYLLLLALLFIALNIQSQNSVLSPENIKLDTSLIKIESYKMKLSIIQGKEKIELGNISTTINKNEKRLILYSELEINQESLKWVDIKVVDATSFKPIYNISHNKERHMVLRFEETISGYYLNNETGDKIEISENATGAYFDSGFYPYLLRWLPYEDGYTSVISIFDYDPGKKTGVITATIKNVREDVIEINGEGREVWKVVATDDISNNTDVSTYYIDKTSRELLKQEIEMAGRKLVMELVE